MNNHINVFRLPTNTHDMDNATQLKKLFSGGNGRVPEPDEVLGYVDVDKTLKQLGAEYGRLSLVLKSRTSQLAPDPFPLVLPEFFVCDLEELLTWVKLYGSRLRRAKMGQATSRVYLKMSQDLEKVVADLQAHSDYRHGFMQVLVVVS